MPAPVARWIGDAAKGTAGDPRGRENIIAGRTRNPSSATGKRSRFLEPWLVRGPNGIASGKPWAAREGIALKTKCMKLLDDEEVVEARGKKFHRLIPSELLMR